MEQYFYKMGPLWDGRNHADLTNIYSHQADEVLLRIGYSYIDFFMKSNKHSTAIIFNRA